MRTILQNMGNWGLFLLIICIACFAVFKALKFIIKHKNKVSKIDILFLFVFFIITLFPSIHINNEERSEKEKRELQPYIPLIKDGKLNENYGQDFNSWFSDRFNQREDIINTYHKIRFYLSKYYRTDTHLIGKDDWVFWGKKTEKNQFDEEELADISYSIKHFYNFCDHNNIHCYIEVVPRRIEFARDKLYRNVPEDEQDRAQQIFEYIDDEKKERFIYPISELKIANKEEAVYYKPDHHWTEYGAYIGYLEIMKRIKRDMPHIKIVDESNYETFYDNKIKEEGKEEFSYGQECRGLGLDITTCPLKDKYRYYKHKNEQDLYLAYYDYRTEDKVFNYHLAPNQETVALIGDSFIENIGPFLAYTFPRVVSARSNFCDLRLSNWSKAILDAGIKIVIIVIDSEYAEHLKDLKY